jgi:hypothetical protein
MLTGDSTSSYPAAARRQMLLSPTYCLELCSSDNQDDAGKHALKGCCDVV